MKIRYMKDKVKRHINLKEEISIHFHMYICIYAKIFKFIFDVNIRPPIKTKEKRLILIEKFIIYSLRNRKAIKTVILKILKI